MNDGRPIPQYIIRIIKEGLQEIYWRYFSFNSLKKEVSATEKFDSKIFIFDYLTLLEKTKLN